MIVLMPLSQITDKDDTITCIYIAIIIDIRS